MKLVYFSVTKHFRPSSGKTVTVHPSKSQKLTPLEKIIRFERSP